MKNRTFIAVSMLIIVAGMAVAGCTSEPMGEDMTDSMATVGTNGDNTVEMKDFKFVPETITVSKGDTVTWTNRDTARHDVTFNGESSPLLGPDEKYSRTLDTAGTYDYYCSVHPSMRGKVIVQ